MPGLLVWPPRRGLPNWSAPPPCREEEISDLIATRYLQVAFQGELDQRTIRPQLHAPRLRMCERTTDLGRGSRGWESNSRLTSLPSQLPPLRAGRGGAGCAS